MSCSVKLKKREIPMEVIAFLFALIAIGVAKRSDSKVDKLRAELTAAGVLNVDKA